MGFLSRYFDKVRIPRREFSVREHTSDRPLNTRDHARNLNQELRKLNMERGYILTPLILLGAGLGFIMKRKYKLASLTIIGFLAQEALIGSRAAKSLPSPAHPEEIELERYALKAERGDFGKLEVIPFR